MNNLDDTIAALASAPGPGMRGIIRISGQDLHAALGQCFRPIDSERWNELTSAARHEGLFSLCDPSDVHDAVRTSAPALPVDVYHWPTRRSYTGQRMAELHVVGSPPLLEAVLTALFGAGVRPARPGEFTLRAFLAGRVDLVQAEAVLGVIDAQDHEELELALQQLAGGLSGRIGQVRSRLIDLLADLEAGLDFVEQNIEFVERVELIRQIDSAIAVLQELLVQSATRMQSTGRQRVVLAGLPNAGKSTLFNALTGHAAALVSDVRGTTRDYLNAAVEWHGVSIELFDTAGCDATSDAIAAGAQRLSDEQRHRADLIVWCTAADSDDATLRADVECRQALRCETTRLVTVRTKADVATSSESADTLTISAHTGRGLKALQEAVAAKLAEPHLGSKQLLGSTAARCRESLSSAVAALERARQEAAADSGEELVVIELRDALDHLGRILGAVYTDDLLDRIFSKFCIGK